MRRTKSEGMHPASKIDSSGSANVQRYNTDADDQRRVAQGMWRYLPALPDIELTAHTKIWQFYNAIDVSLTETWNQTKDSDGALVPALLNERGGGMRFVTGSDQHGYQYENWNFVSTKNKPVEFVNGKATWLLVDAKVSQTDDTFTSLVFGFSEEFSFSDNWAHDNDPNLPFPGYHFGDGAVYAEIFAPIVERELPDDYLYGIWDYDNVEPPAVPNSSINSRGIPAGPLYPGFQFYSEYTSEWISDTDPLDGEYHRFMLGCVPSGDLNKWDIILYDGTVVMQVAESVTVQANINMQVFIGSYSPDTSVSLSKIILIQDE